MTVASGATLSGTGTTGAVTDNGIVSPGVGGVGTLHTGNVTLNSGSTLNVDVTNSGCDLLAVAGTAVLNTPHLNVVNSRTTQLDSPIVFIDDQGVTGTSPESGRRPAREFDVRRFPIRAAMGMTWH